MAKMAHYHYLAKKISNLSLFYKYVRINYFLKLKFMKFKFFVKLEFQKLDFFSKKYSEKFWKFFMVLEFMENSISPNSSIQIVVNFYIFSKQ